MSAQRKRVVFLVPSLTGGGAERVIVTLLRHLDRQRFEPHLALVKATGPYLKDVPADVPIHDMKLSRVRYTLPAILRLTWKLRPHAVLSTIGHLNLALILATSFVPRRVRLLVRENTIPSARLLTDTGNPKLWEWLYRRFYRKADQIVCQSDFMLNDLAQQFGIPREKMVRIYNPVDVIRIRELADARENPYVGAGPHLVAAGRLSREKGFDVLIDAMKLVHEALPSARLTLLGEGPLETILKMQRDHMDLSDVVSFAGFQTNPWPYFKHADLFVLPSRCEGLPNAALEALALGTPVVAADCPGGVREILQYFPQMVSVCTLDHRSLANEILSAYEFNQGARRETDEALQELDAKFGVAVATAAFEELLST